jgi:hypothetical protein
MAFTVVDGRITRINALTDPDGLAELDLPMATWAADHGRVADS